MSKTAITARYGMAIGLVVFAMAAGMACAYGRPGQRCVLEKPVDLTDSYADATYLSHIVVSRDNAAYARMFATGRAIEAKPGTVLYVVELDPQGYAKVRLEGYLETGWALMLSLTGCRDTH